MACVKQFCSSGLRKTTTPLQSESCWGFQARQRRIGRISPYFTTRGMFVLILCVSDVLPALGEYVSIESSFKNKNEETSSDHHGMIQ